MKKLLVVISFLTLFMVAHATVKEVAVDYLTAEHVLPVEYVNAKGNNAATLGDYRFYIRDYQGNNRVLVDYSGNAIERYDYYPYGGLFGEVNPEQWRLYGGKELQTVNGLNLHDFHARWQDYATGRFTTQDSLAEKYHALSPYIYCAGNPIMLTDPSGMRFEYAEDMTPKQREQLDVIITSLKESDLFMIVYEAIEVSKEVVTLQFGETVKDNHGKNVPGQFEPNTEDNTGGNITFDTNHELSAAVVAEELYHSYQNITPNKRCKY